MQSRYYNPEWGRFINADAFFGTRGELLSHNLFAYCTNNPVNSDDPSGYFFKTIADKINEAILKVAVVVFAVVETVIFNNMREQTEKISDAISNTVSNISSSVSRTISKTRTKEAAKTKENEQSTTNLYRAMDYTEYNRFMKAGGKLSNNAPERPNVMDTKWFATNPVDAGIWGKALNPNGYKIVEVTIPTSALKGMYYNQFLDGIGPAYNGTVPFINANIMRYGTVK